MCVSSEYLTVRQSNSNHAGRLLFGSCRKSKKTDDFGIHLHLFCGHFTNTNEFVSLFELKYGWNFVQRLVKLSRIPKWITGISEIERTPLYQYGDSTVS
jgi:hypothetical protein